MRFSAGSSAHSSPGSAMARASSRRPHCSAAWRPGEQREGKGGAGPGPEERWAEGGPGPEEKWAGEQGMWQCGTGRGAQRRGRGEARLQRAGAPCQPAPAGAGLLRRPWQRRRPAAERAGQGRVASPQDLRGAGRALLPGEQREGVRRPPRLTSQSEARRTGPRLLLVRPRVRGDLAETPRGRRAGPAAPVVT